MKQTNLKVNARGQLTLFITISSFILLMFSSCQKQESLLDNQLKLKNSSLARETDGLPYREGSPTVLGEPKRNPYTVRNMSEAWRNLEHQGIFTNTEAHVHTTHYHYYEIFFIVIATT